MLCKKPYMIGLLPCPCMRCMPCRINRRRLWTHRLLLESYKHPESCFVTLTYNQEHYPKNGSLSISDYQLFLKRLRKAVYPRKLRYFLVGEYGDISQRAHYHAAIFGLGPDSEQIVSAAWGLGHTMVGDLSEHSAQYICKYTLKRMTRPDDERLNGRHPEFARMSLKPGIGADAMDNMADVLTSEHGVLAILDDIPNHISYGKKKLPLGRYLMRKLREKIGFKEIGAPQDSIKKYKEEMRTLLKEHQGDKIRPSWISQKEWLSQILVDMNKQKVTNLETRTKIFNKGGSL